MIHNGPDIPAMIPSAQLSTLYIFMLYQQFFCSWFDCYGLTEKKRLRLEFLILRYFLQRILQTLEPYPSPKKNLNQKTYQEFGIIQELFSIGRQSHFRSLLQRTFALRSKCISLMPHLTNPFFFSHRNVFPECISPFMSRLLFIIYLLFSHKYPLFGSKSVWVRGSPSPQSVQAINHPQSSAKPNFQIPRVKISSRAFFRA